MKRIKAAAAFLMRVEWLWLGLLLPVVVLARPAWSPFLLLLPLLWGLRRLASGHFVPPTPLNGALLLLLVMVLVSQYATFDMSFSYSKIANLIYGVALYFAVVAFVGGRRARLWWALAALLGIGWGMALVGLLGTQWKETVPLVAQVTNRLPTATLSLPGLVDGALSPNQLAGVLPWVLFPALLLAGAAWGRREAWREAIRPFPSHLSRFFVTISAVVFGGMLLLTQSRSGYLGLAAGLALAALAPLWAWSRRWALLVVAVGLLGAGGGLAAVGPQTAAEFVFPQVGVETGDFTTGVASLSGRVEIWSRALYGMQDFPFTGMGMNNFRRVVHILYPLFLIPPDTDIAHAHNHLLQAGLDLGLPGLMAYLAIWGLTAVVLGQVWRRSETAVERALALGIGAGLLAHFVYGMLDAVALGSRPGFVFWLLLGVAVGLWQVATAEETSFETTRGAQDGG